MSPIIKHGYGRQPNPALTAFYSSKAWKQTRAAVKARAGGRCEWCGDTGSLDAVHLNGKTSEILSEYPELALDMDGLAAGCRKCHSNFARGNIGRPAGR